MRVFTDDRCLAHRVPFGFPERAERLERILAGLRGAGVEVVVTDEHGHRDAAIDRTHSAAYRERFRRTVSRGEGLFDSPDTPVASGTWMAANGAVDATLHATDWVLAGAGRRALAAVRPPGHHAERELAMGFCYFNNAAVAADFARAEHGLERVAIFDFDVHHGNGTQHIFERDPDVLYASIHQYPFYPGTGAADEVGLEGGEGATLNVPLPVGTGDDGYRVAIRERVLPAIEAHRPQLLVVSAGFDAWRSDPLGGMAVSEAGFEAWGRWIAALAERVCDGRVLATLEGGYDVEALPRLVAAFLRGLHGDAEPASGD